MSHNIIPLDRTFSEISNDTTRVEETSLLSYRSFSGVNQWATLESEYRVVILADAGAGKTVEMRSRAQRIRNSGKPAFFIRIEDLIDDHIGWGLEVGTSDEFDAWLASTEEAWFFLDSVDEARLTAHNAFEKAIKRFSATIRTCFHRVHVYISGRPYSWRFIADREFVERCLPFQSVSSDEHDNDSTSLVIYGLNPLTLDDIRFYAVKKDVKDAAGFVDEIERASLRAMASRPFDLDFLIATWNQHGILGSRYELFEQNVISRLDEIDPVRRHASPLKASLALKGAEILAGAVTFTGKSGIKIYDRNTDRTGVDAETVLDTWEQKDVWTLLERGVFSEAIYSMVGFRHREIRDYLSARWLNSLLKDGHSRRAVESLIFREKYGVQVITPRLRTLVTWLILMDDEIREKALNIQPEIALEGGDVSHLPLHIRSEILNEIVFRIANNTDDHNVRYNSQIALIAKHDLIEEVSSLIEKYYENDDVIYFLGRLVWQIKSPAGTDKMTSVAIDPDRHVYARVGAVRAVMATGTQDEKLQLWSELNDSKGLLPFRILSEVVSDAPLSNQSVDYLFESLSRLEPFRQFEHNDLTRELIGFLGNNYGLNIDDYEVILTKMLENISSLLKRDSDTIRDMESRISAGFRWLLPVSVTIIERLVLLRSGVCFYSYVLDLLLDFILTGREAEHHFREYKGELRTLIPDWPELNDALFWRAVEKWREDKSAHSLRLTDDWPIIWPGHFFKFDESSFPRLLGYAGQKEFVDDKLVALSLSLRICSQSENKEKLLDDIREIAKQHPELIQKVEWYLNPPPDPEMDEINKKHLEFKRQSEERRAMNEHNRRQWIQKIIATPDTIRASSEKVSNDQYWLFQELSRGNASHLAKGLNWQGLVDIFGRDVATAFRDAAMAWWRRFRPVPASGGGFSNDIYFELIFGLFGLETEALERADFPYHMTRNDVELALLYATKEMNGFPDWLEKMFMAFPQQVLSTLWDEVKWELERSEDVGQQSYVIYGILYNAPWSHKGLSERLYRWLLENNIQNAKYLRYCLRLLINGEKTCAELAELASVKIREQDPSGNLLPVWYALYVDTLPDTGIPSLADKLMHMPEDESCLFAQKFVTTLTGKNRDGKDQTSFAGEVQAPLNLKRLYLLMLKYIRPEDDISHASGAAYSPQLRDDAQSAREMLFQWLSEIPGKETYVALTELIAEYPDKNHSQWMMRAARKRAEMDADLELWTDEQVRDFSTNSTFSPESSQQLYEFGVRCLLNIKDWLERGNTSFAETYQKITSETEMRNVITHHLGHEARGNFTCVQEPELANHQRPDIWLQHPAVKVPVPVELKLLDKSWSGPGICERLRNQLAGDYLRENEADSGIFLLVWQGKDVLQKKWMINNKKVGVSELDQALKEYWISISNQYPKIKDIEIIVIDLTLRGTRSAT